MCAADFEPALQTRLLVLQPTPFCNLDCSYCYLPRRNDRSRMSLATLRSAARRLADDGLAGAELSIVWHAGEPLVLPRAWYDDAFGVLADELSGTVLHHALQTNAVLIDDAWCRWFLRRGVDVGVSVDGPAALHDRRRRTRRGGGTHAAVVRGIERLQAHGVPFHAIAVVTADTLADADGFYDWFVDRGITRVGINIDEAEGPHVRSSIEGHEAAHAAFVQRLLERSRDGAVALREIDAAWSLLRAPLPRWGFRGTRWPWNEQSMPLALLTVLHDGRFGSFSPELVGQPDAAHAHFVLGNVHDGGYVAALATPGFARLWADVAAGIAACASRCAHFEQCGGGAPANKRYENASIASGETLHCRCSVQRPFDAVLRHAERMLAVA